MSPLADRLKAQIAQTGPLTVAHYMAACLFDPRDGYYANAPRIGADGDFITAPEISQMFGELIGLWCVHEWDALGREKTLEWIELGPGNGALISDAWRASRIAPAFRDSVRLHLVEVSEPLKGRQAAALAPLGARPRWHGALDTVPIGPSFIIANEFLDCLPIRQFVRDAEGWRERMIGLDGDALAFGLFPHALRPGDPLIPPALHDAPTGAVAEIAPSLVGWIDAIAARLKTKPGRALIIDYAGDGRGDTLQALRAHRKEGPLDSPGAADLTAHVDFNAVKILARASGLQTGGPIPQGDFLRALGIEERAAALTHAHPEREARVARELKRLTGAAEMGVLFKVLCLSSPNLPPPAGF